MATITTIEELEAIYGERPSQPTEPSVVKEAGYVTAHYRTLIEAAPFAVLATSGPEGLDCSPRGDRPGFVRIVDETTLMMPDRRGNNRVDSLRNIVRDPRAALLFMIPGSGTTLRVNGRAHLTTDAELLASFAMDGKNPRSVIVIKIESIYFQCARAIIALRAMESRASRRSGYAADSGADSRRAQRSSRRWRCVRSRVAGAREEIALVVTLSRGAGRPTAARRSRASRQCSASCRGGTTLDDTGTRFDECRAPARPR